MPYTDIHACQRRIQFISRIRCRKGLGVKVGLTTNFNVLKRLHCAYTLRETVPELSKDLSPEILQRDHGKVNSPSSVDLRVLAALYGDTSSVI